MSTPSKTMAPPVAGRVPARTARNVDLPAPLGPMRPVIWPGGTSIDTPSTACRPSKCRWMSSATSRGRSPTTRTSGCSSIFQVLAYGRALEYVARLRPHPFWAEPQEADDEQADRHPLERWDEAGRSEAAWDEASRFLEPDRNEQRTQDRPDVVAAPADDDGGEEDDRLGIEPHRRRPQLDEAHQDRAGQAGNDAADDEHRHLELDRVLADRHRRELAFAHRTQAAPIGRVDDTVHHHEHQHHADGGHRHIEVLIRLRVRVDHIRERGRYECKACRPVQEW